MLSQARTRPNVNTRVNSGDGGCNANFTDLRVVTGLIYRHKK